jgi:TonB-dependent receptor
MTPSNLLIKLTRACLLLAGTALLITAAAAQAVSTGTVEGRVLNVTSGQYVKNARVTADGTTLEAFSGEFGEYRLVSVPAGPTTVRVVYGGLPPVTQGVTVAAGGIAEQNFSVGGTGPAPLKEGEILKLDEFVVASTRELNAAAIATNEQRYAANIKNVVSSDAFGDVNEGNVGEFLKYLPGITVDYVAADVRSISVSGFASNFTGVNIDGGRMASANSANTNRVFELEQVSLNNVARVEVTKVPTADQPMDTLGGSVNMISRTAFEQPRPVFTYKLNLNVHSEDRRDILRKTPGPGNEQSYKSLPGFEFNYMAPLSKTFGIVITGLSSNQFNEQHRSGTTWNFNAAGTGATPATPFLSNYTLQDGPKNSYRDSFSIKADWKAARNHVLSFGGQTNYYKSFFGNRNLNFATGTNAVPTPATGTPLSFGPNFTQGATGRGTVTQGGSFRDKLGASSLANFTYRYTGRTWEADAGASASNSRTWYRDVSRGHFQAISTAMPGAATGTVRIEDLTYPRPGTFIVRDAAGTALDPNSLANYRISTVASTPSDGEATNKAAYGNIKRHLELCDVPFSLKTGVAIRSEDRDNRRYSEARTFVGADGVANTADDSALPYLDSAYSPVDPYWGFRPIQWANAYKLYDLYKSTPNYFQTTTAQAVANETNRINGSEKYGEVITATYLQLETSLFKNRLRLVAGWRYEKTKDTGEGPRVDPDAPFQRNANGSFVLVSGARVRKAEAGAAGSIEELALVRKERLGRASRSYDGSYPSINATYTIRENLLFRFAFAKTFGRPDFTDIVPNTTIDEADTPPAPGAVPGNITIRNPGLRPWSAQNYDASLEYYFEKGGLLTVRGFQKNVSNFWNSTTSILTSELANELGLEQVYVGWQVNTRTNGGESRISGAEFNYNQPLHFIPQWGKFFSLSANATRLHLEGNRAGDFSNFIPRTGNLGLIFNRRPFNVKVNYNYRGRQTLSTQTAINGFQFYAERKYIDVNFEYQISKRATFFLNGRNVTNVPQDRVNIGTNVPYSYLNQVEEYGVQWGLGIKGKF